VTLGKRYGQLDGELTYEYVTAFTWIQKTLGGKQTERLLKLRPLQSREEGTAFLYSDRIPMPKVPASEFLFRP
jgi:hypothetical protein